MHAKISLRISPYLWMHPQRCKDLLALLREYRDTVGEVAFFTSFNHPPLPFAEVQTRATLLTELIPRFKALGLSAGINHLATMGHLDENLEHMLNEPWQRLVDVSGSESPGCYCVADPAMQEYVRQSYIALAKTAPDFIWIDDDVRMESHPTRVTYACFCDRCLAQFSEETGRTWTREVLHDAFSSGSREEQLNVRKQWLTHNRRYISDLLALIRKAVDTVNPALPLGLMTAELYYSGYGYVEWAAALAGTANVQVMWRPGGGFYTDEAMHGALEKAHAIGRQIAPLSPSVVDIQSEIENFPYQRLKKSAATLGLEVGTYIAAGCTGAALNIFGISADPLDEYHTYFARVRELRGFFEREVAAFGRSQCTGIWTATNPEWFAALGWTVIGLMARDGRSRGTPGKSPKLVFPSPTVRKAPRSRY
ncbi:MAG: hypothetical protein ACYDBB_03400 [Armatimonadota bacterium]